MKVTAILKGAKDKHERRTVYIRTNVGEKRNFKALNIKITEKQWDSKGMKVFNHPKASIYNAKIKKEIAERELSYGAKEYEKKEFIKFGRECIEHWRAMRSKGEPQLRQYHYELNKLERFKNILLSDMDNAYFKGLLKYCYSLGNKENTAWKTFAKVHAILQQAVDDNLLVKNPMDAFREKPVYRDPKKEFITPEKLKDIEKFALTIDSAAQRFAALWFLIGCYTGMRFSDMKTFDKKKHIMGGRLVKETEKTGEVISLPVRGKIKQLLDLVDYKPLRIKNEPYNRILKVIAKKCDIEINLTSHTSRHTAAMMLANAGVSIEVTAAILGHSSTRHTRTYYKISNKRIDSEIDKII